MDQITQWLVSLGTDEKTAALLTRPLLIAGALILAGIAYWLAKHFLLRGLETITQRSKTNWDDALLKRKVFKRLAYLAPALVIYGAAPIVFSKYETIIAGIRLAAEVYMILVSLFVADAFLSALVDICNQYEFSKRIPVRGFVQVAKIILYIFIGIFVLSLLLGQPPTFFLGGMGAMTAVLLLVFKDSILGLVAGIQLSGNQMVRIGDWIEMPKYGADGDVIDIALTTIKVQNWDKTISTIPAYALVSDSFKNWRGMSESGGRRIKRAVYIDMTSIKFCTEAMLERFKKFHYLTKYIETKKKELAEYNSSRQVDDSELVNGRRLTNIGTFRAYLVEYLRDHPKIHKNMTFLVRQLPSTSKGLPIEIYVFSNDQVWANYEAIQADIFDHVLAVIPEFELKVFQEPTGADFQTLRS